MVRIDAVFNIGKTITKSLSQATKNTTVNNAILDSANTFSNGISRTNKVYLNMIDNIPVKGIKKEEEPIWDMLKTAMYDLLGKTKGKATLPKEIRFEYYQARKHPIVMLENIMKAGENANILKSAGMYKTRNEVAKMTIQEQFKYLQDIFKSPNVSKHITIPENTALITTPNYVFHHELGHINHNKLISDDIFNMLRSQQKISEWQNNKKIQEVCSRVSGYSSQQPIEFVAEVYSGLSSGCLEFI